MGVRRTLAAALAAPLLLLAACGGGDTSIADPPISPDPTTSSPTQQPHRETPEHFIRRFYAAEKTMENTGKTDAYRTLVKGCKSCVSLTKEVERFYTDGGYVKWGGLRIESIRPYPSQDGGRTFKVEGIAKSTTYKTSGSASPSQLDGGPTTELVTLSKSDTSWLVSNFAKLGSS